MTRNSDEIRRHYEGADDAAGLVAGIAAAIEGLGRSVTTTQLAALDQIQVPIGDGIERAGINRDNL